MSRPVDTAGRRRTCSTPAGGARKRDATPRPAPSAGQSRWAKCSARARTTGTPPGKSRAASATTWKEPTARVLRAVGLFSGRRRVRGGAGHDAAVGVEHRAVLDRVDQRPRDGGPYGGAAEAAAEPAQLR